MKLYVTHGETEYRNGEVFKPSYRVSTGTSGDDTAILSGLTKKQANRALPFLERLPIVWTDWDEAIKQLAAMGYGSEYALMLAACARVQGEMKEPEEQGWRISQNESAV